MSETQVKILLFFLFLVFVILGILIVKFYRRKIFIWFPGYFRRNVFLVSSPARRTYSKHILFCFVDHFEPGWNKADLSLENKRVDNWLSLYPSIAKQFVDADGYHPRHTWFYPPHYFRETHIMKLLALCREGFGEIEMHLHHDRIEPFPDTSESLRKKIKNCISLYSRYGIFQTEVNGFTALRYAFIHGDWALDNSRPLHCGVNDELTILKETGCYADFTFPSYMVSSQPRQVNSIYYALDEPCKPKSYNFGVPARVGGGPGGDLMMIQGPLGFRWKGRRNRWFPSVDDGEIASSNPPTPERVDFWIKTGIHVLGKPEWIVVKVFTHGAPQRENAVLLGEPICAMHRYLNETYNDGRKYHLHYVTARELYNIIKAAERGNNGNPAQYRNFILTPYRYVKNSCP
jgi:hypothetical protein